jgi:hypothetical protein
MRRTTTGRTMRKTLWSANDIGTAVQKHCAGGDRRKPAEPQYGRLMSINDSIG